MPPAETIQNVLWTTSLALQIVLIVILFHRRNHRAYPFFTAYIALGVAQSMILALVYRWWGFTAFRSFQVAWLSQSLVLAARASAVAELCRKVLGIYRGIWALAIRLLAVIALIVVVYACYVSSWRWKVTVLEADRATELAIASIIVVLLAFSRYYRVPITTTDRLIAIGLCIYSSSYVINNSVDVKIPQEYYSYWNLLIEAVYIFERLLYRYFSYWNLPLQVVSVVSLLIWIVGLWYPVPRETEQPELMEASLYQRLSPEINLRLRMLNEQLLAFWRTKVPHL